MPPSLQPCRLCGRCDTQRDAEIKALRRQIAQQQEALRVHLDLLVRMGFAPAEPKPARQRGHLRAV